MKQIIFQITLLMASCFWLSAQTSREMVVETTTESGMRVIRTCGSPDQGVLVFKTGITDLNFKLNMQAKLLNQSYDSERNEYVLCVEPTTRQYWVTISGAGYEAFDIEVQEIKASEPRFFRIASKQPNEISVTAKDLIDLGDIRFNNNEFAEAESHYLRANEEEKDNNALLLRKLGETCIKLEKPEEATIYLQRAVNLRPRDDESLFMLGNVYFSEGNYERAASSIKAAVDLVSGNRTYSAKLQEVLQVSPERAKIYADLGTADFERGNYKDALTYFSEAEKADPQNKTYQTKAINADLRMRQQIHMDAAANAYRTAEAQKNATASEKSKLYKEPLTHVTLAERLGPLTTEWMESANYYKLESKKYKRRYGWYVGATAVVVGGLYLLKEKGILGNSETK